MRTQPKGNNISIFHLGTTAAWESCPSARGHQKASAVIPNIPLYTRPPKASPFKVRDVGASSNWEYRTLRDPVKTSALSRDRASSGGHAAHTHTIYVRMTVLLYLWGDQRLKTAMKAVSLTLKLIYGWACELRWIQKKSLLMKIAARSV